MPPQDIKLYSAYSVVNDFRNRDNVTFIWFVKRRTHPVATYKEYLKGYGNQTNEALQDAMQRQLDALFLEKELAQLKQYLSEFHDTELFSRTVALPLDKKNYQPLPEGERPQEAGAGIYRLSQEGDYKLSFDVWGFYNLRGSPLTALAKVAQTTRQPGVRFLKTALKELDIDPLPPDELLDDLVRYLYTSGFSVSQQRLPSTGPEDKPQKSTSQRPLPE